MTPIWGLKGLGLARVNYVRRNFSFKEWKEIPADIKKRVTFSP